MEDSTLGPIGQISIRVKDTERATRFYRDQLGLHHLFTAGHLSFFDCHGVRLMLDIPEKPEFDHPSSILYFKVANIQAAHAAMKERGAHFEDEPHLIAKLPGHDLWMCFFRDTENNLMGLMSEVAN